MPTIPEPWIEYAGRGIMNPVDDRNVDALVDVVRQFDVEHNPRYQPRDGNTYCATFAWDVTRALNCEIPHWVAAEGGAPTTHGKGVELNINHAILWLQRVGQRYGWSETTHVDAGAQANNGRPAVVTWLNPSGAHGHIAVVVPPYGPEGLLIAQAGETCFYGKPLAHGFGPDKQLQFWVHA